MRETIVAVVVSSLLSLVFALLVSQGRTMPLWGPHGIAFDFLPQLLIMTAAMTLAITLLTRRRLKAGAVAPLAPARAPLPGNVVLRALLFGLLATLVFAPPSIAILALLGVTGAPALVFVVGKVLYGAGVSLLLGPPITLAALSGARP